MRGRKTTALLLTAAALTASSPESPAAEKPSNPSLEFIKTQKRSPASASARSLLKQLGGKVLNMRPRGINITVASSIDTLGYASRSANIDTGSSLVPGSNDEYFIEASTDDVGRNGRFDRSDVDRVEISSGSYTDGEPLFSLRLYHVGINWMNDPLFSNSFYARGTLVDEAGERLDLLGSTNGNPRFIGEQLDKTEVANTGAVMNSIINEALNNQPTHIIEPPFDPLPKPGA